MSWFVLVGLVASLLAGFLFTLTRRLELARMERAAGARREARRQGSDEAKLQHPVVDLSRCLGCGTCVVSCPEEGVLDLLHGQAQVVNAARCKGIAACARECPVGAISVTVADLAHRRDVPALTGELEALGSPGLFLAGEVTAHTLVKKAIEHGTAVAREVARRTPGAGDAGTRRLRRLAAASAASANVPSSAGRVARLRERLAAVSSASALAERPGLAELFAPERAPSDEASVAELELAEAGVDELPLDLLIVGAGPAGLACTLEAKRLGLRALTIEREREPGGTVAKYPRAKLVITEPVELPLHGRLAQPSYTKEELIALWNGLAEREELAIRCGEKLTGVERDALGRYVVRTEQGAYTARHVCLALGRRGEPRKLGVPGEELAKVAYGLLDAQSFTDRRALVVGGGDSAVEAALALAEQPGNEVTLSYRKSAFFRIRARNEERLRPAVDSGRVKLLLQSEVRAIRAASVELELAGGDRLELANDDVLVLIGGEAPFALLERAGVSLDPELRTAPPPPPERGTGLVAALGIALALTVLTAGFALWHLDYYALPLTERPTHPKHAFLRPGLGLGLGFGLAAAALIALNLCYLARRSPRTRLRFGSLRLWMTSHVATGVLAFLCASLHAAMAPRHTVGGDAYWMLALLLVTGAIGRYLYAWVPRAANGRELELAEVEALLEEEDASWSERRRRFQRRAQREVEALVQRRQWKRSFLGRALALVGAERELRRLLRAIQVAGAAEGVPPVELRRTLALARRAHRTAVAAAHLEDLRALLDSWRYLHRWGAALMVLLVVLHIAHALLYGAHYFGGGGG